MLRRPILRTAWENDIVFVVAAGNLKSDDEYAVVMGDYSPQRYGRADNAIITVNSMDADGRPYARVRLPCTTEAHYFHVYHQNER